MRWGRRTSAPAGPRRRSSLIRPCSTVANGVADGGTRVVGASNEQAFVWEPATAMRSLADVLAAAGQSEQMRGWTLLSLVDVTRDGKTAVGIGTSPEGVQQGFLVRWR